MRKLLKFDEEANRLEELDLKGIRQAGANLVAAINASPVRTASNGASLQPLLEYGELARTGQVTARRSWAVDPMRYEFREGLLPPAVDDAYSTLVLYTHGNLRTPTDIVRKDGQAYVWVDCVD